MVLPTTKEEPKRFFIAVQKACKAQTVAKYRLKKKEEKGKYRSTDGVMSPAQKRFGTSTTTEVDRLVKQITKNPNQTSPVIFFDTNLLRLVPTSQMLV
jgi:hypothetical protein